MSVEVGIIVDGKVTGIREFGAFVEFKDNTDGVHTGLVHISEVAEGYVKDIKTHLNENQMVKVKVLSISGDKISLSIKKAIDKPIVETAFKRPERPYEHRRASFNNNSNSSSSNSSSMPNFEDMLSRFIKDSDERIHDIKRNVESKRGSSRR